MATITNRKDYENYFSNCNTRSWRKNVLDRTIVYRVENEQGEGPFKTLNDEFKEESRKYFRPSKLFYMRPDQDFDVVALISMGFFIREYNKNYRFGFTSIAQMKKWISAGQLSILKQSGYSVKKYEAIYVLTSKNQCIFDIRKARRI